MALMSPGIEVKEKDFSLIAPNVSSGVGGMVGRFTKGPIEVPVLVSSENDLVSIFGEPNNINANDWHTVAEFLRYTNSCWVVRSANTGILNATSTATGFAVKNRDDYEGLLAANFTTIGEIAAKDSGTSGNGLGVIIVDSATWTAFLTWNTANLSKFPGQVSLANNFQTIPGTSAYMASKVTDGIARNDEVHVLVLDVTGVRTGIPYTVLAKYEGLSKASDAVDYRGLSIYYPNVLNEADNYVWWSKHPVQTAAVNDVAIGSTAFDAAVTLKVFAQISIVAAPNFFITTLSGGVTGTSSTVAEIKTAYDKLANKDLYNVNLVMTGAFSVGTTGEIEKYVLESIAHARKDCVAFVSPHTTGAPIRDSATAITQIAAFKTSVGVSDSVASYGFMDSGMKYVYDRYSKRYRWIPLNGDMAGLCARTDATNDPWWSPGGYNRGGVKNVIKLAHNPNLAQRDFLYPKGINPVIIDPASGPTLLGDRTMTAKPSAFDRINVRRLFIVLEKSISTAAKWQLFEFNDPFTRAQFKNMVEPFLRGIQGRRGITDFLVKCDAINNTGDIIDRNEFVAEIFVKPARSINFITLSFVATRTDVSFSQVVGG